MVIDRDIARKTAALMPGIALYGAAFGATAQQAGFPLSKIVGLSLLVFGGGSQFAAVGVISSGGSGVSAVITGLLVNARLLAFGIALAPILPRSWVERFTAAQLVVDEPVALATAETDRAKARLAFWYCGLSLWVIWQTAAVLGATVLTSVGDPKTFGLDAATPAAFVGLVAPRLRNRPGLFAAAIGAAVALVLIPLAPAGIPVMVSAFGAVIALGLTWRSAP